MQILLVNDDGPPSEASPYFLPFVDALTAAGHHVRVIIPDKPSSWISKMHAYGKSLTATPICPELYRNAQSCPTVQCERHRWWVLNGSPASCTQIGLFNMGWAAKDIDLVISGPNHGPNASTIYNMSSETVGGALEGALCGKKSVSLSFASKDPQPQAITRAACDRAIGLIELLVASWHPEVEVYNVNVPMIESVADCPAEFAIPTRSYWKAAALFTETPSETPTKETLDSQTGKNGSNNTRYFKWRPDLTDVEAATSSSRPGEDLWVSTNDMISITGFQANFAVAGHLSGRFEGGEC